MRCLPAELEAMLQRISGRSVTLELVGEVSEFTSSLLELVWSFSFAEQQQELAVLLRQGLMEIGRRLDAGCTEESLLQGARGLQVSTTSESKKCPVEEPSLILTLPGMAVVLKPPSWEVDARPPSDTTDTEEEVAPRLSSFLQKVFSREMSPLVHCREQQYGIIHRLDVPSSGLILAGTSFLGYYALRWQQDTYTLGRHYLVLCHGRLDGSRIITARIKTAKSFPARSEVSAEGKPAWTLLEPLAVLRRAASAEVFSVLAVVIRTGRTHQIRVHTKHIGHPTVTDGKYTDPAVYNSDLSWCPRNFLHRFRLTFEDSELVQQQAVAPLPEDLCSVLADLDPEESSRQMVSQLLNGWVPSLAGNPWKMPETRAEG